MQLTTTRWEVRIMTRSWFPWLRTSYCRNIGRRADGRPPFVPRLLVLEDRTLPSTFMVSNLADSGAGSLRQAVLDANASHDTDQIVFAPSLQGTIALRSGQLTITDDNLTITGPGPDTIALSGSNSSRLFDIAGGSNATVSQLAFTQGRAGCGGAILQETGAALAISHCTFNGNQAIGEADGDAVGGAIFTSAGASLRVDSCT